MNQHNFFMPQIKFKKPKKKRKSHYNNNQKNTVLQSHILKTLKLITKIHTVQGNNFIQMIFLKCWKKAQGKTAE